MTTTTYKTYVQCTKCVCSFAHRKIMTKMKMSADVMMNHDVQCSDDVLCTLLFGMPALSTQEMSMSPHVLICGRTWSELFPRAPADAIDLMKKLLVFNPNKRPTAQEVHVLPPLWPL